MLNYEILIICLSIIIGLIIYLFYFNRIVGFIIGRILRLLFWNQGESSIWVHVGSIHVSVLAGRILFKDLAYHSSNQTIRVVKGQVSWRYWIRLPAGEQDLSHARVVGEDVGLNLEKAPLSCRLHVSLQGLEWFIYNRTAAYDNIVSAMENSAVHEADVPPGRPSREGISSLRKIFSWTSAIPDSTHLGPPISLVSSIYNRTPRFLKTWVAGIKRQLPSLDPKDLLPIGIEATKGAIICGNASTPNLLVSEFRSGRGTYGIVPSRSKHDQYKQVLNIVFQNATVSFVENSNFEDKMTSVGQKLHTEIHSSTNPPLRSFSYLSFSAFAKLWRRHKLLSLVTPRSRAQGFTMPNPVHTAATWSKRRARAAADEETPLGIDPLTLEYAKEPKFLEAPVLELLYYADSVGVVPDPSEHGGQSHASDDPLDIGNGDLPPEWGIDIAIRGGVLRYGPWTDRQRVSLQQVFSPQTFTDATPVTRLKPGDARVWPCLKILVELRDGVSLQVPFRESSKNWMWDGEVQVPNRPRKRESASIHLRAGDSSTISYMMPMVATARGYEPTLNVHLDTVTVTSSLNDIRILTADSCVIRNELPSPLKWNDQRQWTFVINLRRPVFYLLRDHVNMFTDLSKDWSSGPPHDYNKFIPMLYKAEVEMQNYEINTYVNDHNIIDKPLLRDENALMTLRGTRLRNTTLIPLTKYRPDLTAVSFWVEGADVRVSLTLPRWNTRSLYSAPHRNSDIGRIGLLRLDASYTYYSEVHPENIDQLKLSFMTKDVIYKAGGWTIRHFMIFRNNYFGTFTHFSTLYEYLEKQKKKQPLGDPVDLQYREGSSNALQVQLDLVVEGGNIIMPATSRGYENDHSKIVDCETDIGTCVLLSLPELQLELRTHDYYMELALNEDTITGIILPHCSEDLQAVHELKKTTTESFVIDGLEIIAHRLFGPQPRTSTYLCIWEIHVDRIMARLDAADARRIGAAFQAFGLNFTDAMNAPAPEYDVPVDPDVTFLKLCINRCNLVWHVQNTAVEVSLNRGLRLDSNDLAGNLYSKVTSIRVPEVAVKFLLARDAASRDWYEAMRIALDANVDIYSAPPGWRKKAQAQAEFLAAQDGHTGRAVFLYLPDQTIPNDTLAPGRGAVDSALYLPQLRIPAVSGSTPARPPRMREQNPQVILRRRFAENFGRRSDSEGEENVSEADRDARLARSRPQRVHVAVAHDNDSISSGDEEDDDDLTETYHSDSDDEHQTSSGSWHALRSYSKYTCSYDVQSLKRPSRWHTSPYRVTRDRSIRLQQSVADILEDWQSNSPELKNADTQISFDDDVDSTIVRFTTEMDTTVQFTPLVPSVLDVLLEEAGRNDASPEIQMDAIIVDHVRAISSQKDVSPRTATVLDVQLSTVHLTSMQLISSSLGTSKSSSHPSSSDRVPTFFELVVHDLRLKQSSYSGEPENPDLRSFCVSFSRLASGTASTELLDVPCHILAGPTSVSFDEGDLHVIVGDLYMEAMHHAPEQLVPSAIALCRSLLSLREPIKKYTTSTAKRSQHVISCVAKAARGRPFFDSLSTIQPAYLIQQGRPHKIRTDAGFKYLVFLRRALEYADPSARQEFSSNLSAAPDQAMLDGAVEFFENYLLQLGLDTQAMPKQSPLASLLSPHARDHAPGLPIASASVRFDKVHAIYLPLDQCQSEFLVTAVSAHVHRRKSEWYQPHFASTTKSSTTLSLGDRNRQDVDHFKVILSVGDVTFSIYPQLVRFAQHIIHTARLHECRLTPKPTPSATPTTTPATASRAIYADIVVSTNSFKFRAGAEKLIIEYKASKIDYASTILSKPSTAPGSMEISMNHSMLFAEARLQACAAADISRPDEFAVLAALILTDGKVNIPVRLQPDTCPTIRVVAGLENLHLNVPRSALRLYRFMEEWREDYLPGLNETIRDLLAELKAEKAPSSPASSPSQSKVAVSWLPRQVEVAVHSFRVSLQVMRGTWMAWEVGRTIAFMNVPNTVRGLGQRTFGMQIGSQTFVISSRDKTNESVSHVRIKLPLPTFTTTGHFSGSQVDGLILVESFVANVKPAHWDTLLTVQQKFGQDFNDLVSLIAERRNHHQTPSKSTHQSPSPTPLRYNVLARMKGFCIGLEGVSSTVLLECDYAGGALARNERGLTGHFEIADLSLSLAPLTKPQTSHVFDRGRRSAFVIIGVRVGMNDMSRTRGQVVDLLMSKIHAVMQPSSIGQLGDFVDHLQAEIAVRGEQRAQDLAEFKEKTRNLLRTLELKTDGTRSETLSWLDRYIINISVNNVGVAFPLAFDEDLQITRPGKLTESTVKAFLFSIKSVTFNTQRGESGQASMEGFSFQFIPRFNQSNDADFCGWQHVTRNRLIYPNMKAQLRSERSNESRQLHIAAEVDGFELDIDSSVPDYISSLIEVYRLGKDRVDRFAGRTALSEYEDRTPSQAAAHSEPNYSSLLTSNVFLALSFKSGSVRMFSQAASIASRPRAISTPSQEPLESALRELGAEVFKLPEVTVWGEYRATPASAKLKRGHVEPSTLLFKSTVHSSQNTLRPSLLPFLTEVIDHIEARIKKASKREVGSTLDTYHSSLVSTPSEESSDRLGDSVSSMRISLSLRIDQSRLELTCQPDVNVIAGLHWDSGGFVVNISPGAHRVTFSGSVGGLSIGLKHGFLSEECVSLHARDLGFTVNFAKAKGSTLSSVSVVCDTEFSGGVRFSRLQDILCFKAVWLDRIPVINGQPASPAPLSSRTASHTTASSISAPKQEMSTGVLVRLRKVDLDIDLGQSISSTQLHLSEAILRSNVTEKRAEVSLYVRDVEATATGNLAGHFRVPDFMFQTVHLTEQSAQSQMLDLRMTSGPLDISLESEYQKILLYRAEPLDVRIYDDWSTFTDTVQPEDRRVRLTFTVQGTDVTAVMNVSTIPRLVSYANKFKATLDAQKEGASRESQAFRISNPSKPENPLSDVANAMFNSAKSKLRDAEAGFSYVIGQRLSLELRTLRLVIFPRNMRDPELAQFIGSNVHARLDRLVESDSRPPERDLHLSFSSISISKLAHLNYGLVSKEQVSDSIRWIDLLTKDASEATIFSLPSMDMHMHSNETVEDGGRVLPYDFSSRFSQKQGVKEEDIYITLNMSLYSWLTILRKTLAREMEQVQASAEVRPPVAGVPQPTALRRGKAPEPLVLNPDREREASGTSLVSPDTGGQFVERVPLPHVKSTPARFFAASPSSADWTVASPMPMSPTTATSNTTSLATAAGDSLPLPSRAPSPGLPATKKTMGLVYRPQNRTIERLTMRQLGEATPDVMHPFFMKKSGFNLEDSLPQYVHEYATMPTEEIMKALLKLYSKQLRMDTLTDST